MDRIHPDDKGSFSVNWKGSIDSDGTRSFEYRYLGQNDRTIWIWGNAAPLKDIDGTVTGYVSTNVDITERKRVEEDLLEKERTIAKASNLAKMGYWIWKADKGVITSSDGLSLLLGIPAGTTLPHDHFFQMVHPDDRKAVIGALEETLKGKGEFNIEHRMIRSDGSTITVRDTVEVTTAKGNRPVFILGVVHDISDLKKVSKVLRETENLHRIVFDTIAEGVVVHDPHGTIVTCNAEAARMIGYPSKEMLISRGDLGWDLIYEDGRDCPPNEHPFTTSMTNGKHLNNEIRGIRSRSGETKWISINTRTLHQGAGAPPMAIVVSFTDITSKKSAEIELKRSEDKFRATIDQSSDGIIIIDADARIIEWNLAQTKIFGYTRDEMLGRPIEGYEHKGPRDGERSLAFLEMMQANMNALDARSDHAGIDGMFEFSVQCKDGCPKTVQVSMFPVMTSGVKIYCSISRDITDQKDTERSLARNKEEIDRQNNLLKTLFKTLPVGIFMVESPTGKPLLANDMACQLLGRGILPDVTERNLVEVYEAYKLSTNVHYPPNEMPVLLGMQGLSTHVDDMLVVRPDGSKKLLEVFGSPVTDGNGKIWASLVNFTDITERKNAEEALRQSEERFRSLADEAPVGIYETDPQGCCVYMNKKWLEIAGQTRKEALGDGWKNGLHPEDRTEIFSTWNRHVSDREPWHQEYRFMTPGGKVTWVLGTAMAMRSENGNVLGYIGINVDITERKLAEEALRESEIRFRELAELLPQTVFEMDLRGSFNFVNQHAFDMFGYTYQDLVQGIEAMNMLIPEDRERGQRDIQEILQGKEKNPYEYTAQRKDGSTFSILISSTAVLRQGRPVGIRGVIVDITERKRAEEALRLANRKLNLLSSITRHDINNQLMTLAGNMSLLDRKNIGLSSDEHLRRAETAVERISSTIQFTKTYEGIGVHAPFWQEVRGLVDTGVKDIALGSIKLINHVPAGIEVFADPLILKVFYNLIDNSVRHGGRITTISFSVGEKEGSPTIICEDDGIGVKADKKERLFMRDFGKEHGLGLFLAREILAITGITITEMGEAGRGARFVMTIPRGGLRSNN
jgi:PAS domain S-box-containing protein